MFSTLYVQEALLEDPFLQKETEGCCAKRADKCEQLGFPPTPKIRSSRAVSESVFCCYFYVYENVYRNSSLLFLHAYLVVCEEYVEGYEGPCMVVDGKFTIFLDIYEELGDQLELFLIDLMNIQTALDGAHPYIEKVRYIDLRPDSITGSEEEEEEDVRQTGANTALTSGFYAVVAAGAFLVLGTAIFYRRRRARIQDGDASTNFPSSDQVLE
jgi:hypothetical protein